MYSEFFGLNEKPFSITPDPRYLYLSDCHADALAHLVYGISESGGFIQLTGEVGTGKTTLVRTLLQQLPDSAEIALILNPQLSATEFLLGICEELAVTTNDESSPRAIITLLNNYLLKAHANGRRVVLIVDEAQTLSAELLEQVRLLTNLETPTQKLLQIILIGQPELRDLLRRREMRQLAQRITGRYHLEPLDKNDTRAYIEHRLQIAGCQRPVFTHCATAELHRRAHGIPRLINVIADRALLAGYSRDCPRVDRALVRQAAAEVFGRRTGWLVARNGYALACIALVGVVAVAALTWYSGLGTAAEASSKLSVASIASAAPTVSPTVAVPVANTAAGLPEGTTTTPSGLGVLLATLHNTSADSAFARLFTIWGAHYNPSRGDACTQAVEQDLECLSHHRGSLAELRNINRPAILSLRDNSGRQHQVVLAHLGYDDATLLAGNSKIHVGTPALIHAWLGQQTILWQPALRHVKVLKPGMRGPAVAWLRQSLAQIRGEPVDNNPSLRYDTQLEAAVRQYQRRHSLNVDGIVGARTQIALRTDLGNGDTPTLSGN